MLSVHNSYNTDVISIFIFNARQIEAEIVALKDTRGSKPIQWHMSATIIVFSMIFGHMTTGPKFFPKFMRNLHFDGYHSNQLSSLATRVYLAYKINSTHKNNWNWFIFKEINNKIFLLHNKGI